MGDAGLVSRRRPDRLGMRGLPATQGSRVLEPWDKTVPRCGVRVSASEKKGSAGIFQTPPAHPAVGVSGTSGENRGLEVSHGDPARNPRPCDHGPPTIVTRTSSVRAGLTTMGEISRAAGTGISRRNNAEDAFVLRRQRGKVWSLSGNPLFASLKWRPPTAWRWVGAASRTLLAAHSPGWPGLRPPMTTRGGGAVDGG